LPNIPEIKARYEAAPGRRVVCDNKADAEFIEHARADLRAVVTALEEAQGKLDAALNWIGGCSCKHCPEIRRILKGE
jgi:hypothetical protein